MTRAFNDSGLTISKAKLQDLVRSASEREFSVIHDPKSKCVIVKIKLKQ